MIFVIATCMAWLSGAATLIYMGWDYWAANGTVVASLSIIALTGFHVRTLGGSAASLARIAWLDVLPMLCGATALYRISDLPQAVNVTALAGGSLVLLIGGVVVHQIWTRQPASRLRLTVWASTCVVLLLGYPLCRYFHDGDLWSPSAIMIALAMFAGYAFKAGWDASTPSLSREG